MTTTVQRSAERDRDIVALAQLVLDDRLSKISEEGLVARVEYKPANRFENGLIGFILSVPSREMAGYQVASAPALTVKDATPALLGEAFDEGLTVIRNEIEKVDA